MQRIGLVVSGGLAKGAYQLGVLKAMEELVDRRNIVAISASSIGVLNSYAYINGKLDEAEDMWRRVDYKSTTAFIRDFIKSPYLDNCIKRISEKSREITADFYVTLLNTTLMEIKHINIAELFSDIQKKYVRASVALPPFNKPIQIMNQGYVDGALVDNIPISPFLDKEFDCIICIYFDDYNYSFENDEIDNKTIKINQQSDMFIKNVFVFKHEYIEKMIEDGYLYGRQVLTNFFEQGKLKPSFRNEIQIFNKENNNIHWYVTCEVVTKKLNKAADKVLRQKRRHEHRRF